MQIRFVGAELFHAEGRTDMAKLIFAFRNFAKAHKIDKIQFTTRAGVAISTTFFFFLQNKLLIKCTYQ